MSAEAPIRAESREELVYLLSQASELEHGLMCEYLFAIRPSSDCPADRRRKSPSNGVTASGSMEPLHLEVTAATTATTLPGLPPDLVPAATGPRPGSPVRSDAAARTGSYDRVI
jgi:hypothetical protein